MNFRRSLMLAFLTLLLTAVARAAGITDAGFPMVDPALDDPAKPWCYFTHPVSVIGMPWASDNAIQVTPEGCINTGEAEFCLFYGDTLRPMASRQRQFLDGWIPVVGDHWQDGSLVYSWEAFSANLDDFDAANTLQFVRLAVRNTGSTAAIAKVAAGCRVNGGLLRERPGGFNPAWLHEIKHNELLRDDHIVCCYEPADRWEAVSGVPYVRPFRGRDLGMSARTEAGVAHYQRRLPPGQTAVLTFKLPHHVVAESDAKYRDAMRAADYDTYRAKTVAYWTDALTRRSIIHTPGEPLIEQAHRATAVHVMLGTRTRNGARQQTDGLPYPDLFIAAIYDYGQLYENFGLAEFIRANIPHCLARQQPNGLFVDIAVSHGAKIHCAHGQTTAYLCEHVLSSRDRVLGRQIFPAIRGAVQLIANEHRTQPHGLMSSAPPYDNEMIKGQWTSHNYWTLIGLRAAIRLARFLDHSDTAAEWLALYDDYERTVLKAVHDSAAADGYVPTGLYGFVTGNAARGGFAEFQTDQDWENEMLLWPTELLRPGDPLVAGTLARLRATKFREGIMTYRNGQHLHQYITTRAINQFNANGQPREALIDMYHALLHAGSAYESFENMIRPWTDRDVEFCPPPHAWGCANSSNTIRNLFVMEQGGRGGLKPDERDILLLNAVSPAWLVEGRPLGIEKAPTSFGMVTVLMTPRRDGADVAIRTNFHTRPRNLVLRVPYFAKLASLESDDPKASIEGSLIRLSPDTTRVSLKWTIDPDADRGLYGSLLLRHRREVGFWPGKRSAAPKAPAGFLTDAERAHPPEPLSFRLVRSAWQAEYARRFALHVAAGGRVKTFMAVPLEPSNAHRAMAAKSPEEMGVLVDKPVTCSSSTSDHSPELANDGIIAPTNYWESTDKHAWWQVDLGATKLIRMVRVVPYYRDPNRYYQFVVKTSVDAKKWDTFLDMSDNTKPLGIEGASYTGQPTPMRYLRVEMLKNSANEGKHLVEVLAK
jgi:hypothetical protein